MAEQLFPGQDAINETHRLRLEVVENMVKQINGDLDEIKGTVSKVEGALTLLKWTFPVFSAIGVALLVAILTRV